MSLWLCVWVSWHQLRTEWSLNTEKLVLHCISNIATELFVVRVSVCFVLANDCCANFLLKINGNTKHCFLCTYPSWTSHWFVIFILIKWGTVIQIHGFFEHVRLAIGFIPRGLQNIVDISWAICCRLFAFGRRRFRDTAFLVYPFGTRCIMEEVWVVQVDFSCFVY